MCRRALSSAVRGARFRTPESACARRAPKLERDRPLPARPGKCKFLVYFSGVHYWTRMTAIELARFLESFRYATSSEAVLQEGIAEALGRAGVAFEREVELLPGDRIDFLAGPIGVEIKLAAGLSQVTRQLHRYAQSTRISELLLVTGSVRLARVPRSLNDKPVHVAALLGGLV